MNFLIYMIFTWGYKIVKRLERGNAVMEWDTFEIEKKWINILILIYNIKKKNNMWY